MMTETAALPPPRGPVADATAPRDWSQALKRGFAGRCPHCGSGRLFGRFLKTVTACEVCATRLDGHRADDGPPYLVILIVGHVVVGLNLAVEQTTDWPLWLHFAIWPALALGLALVLLQPVKGAFVAYQWALRLHGFDPSTEPAGTPGGGPA